MSDDERSDEGSVPEGAPETWYYLEGGRPAGPVSFAALVERLLDGRLDAESLVWTPGQDDWRSASEVPGPDRLVRSDAGAVPPASDAVPPPPPEEEDGGAGEGVEGGAPQPADDEGPEADEEEAGLREAMEDVPPEFFDGEALAPDEPTPDEPEGVSAGTGGDGPGDDGDGGPGRAGGSEDGEDGEEDRAGRRASPAFVWIEDHLAWAAAGGAVLAGALVVLVLAVDGDGGEGAAGPAATDSSPPIPAVPGEAVRRHAAALADSLSELETADPRRDSLLARPEDGALLLEVGFRGLRRLPDPEVLAWARAWEAVLQSADAGACRRLAAWRASSEEVWRALARLRATRREALLARLRRAAVAEIRGEPVPREAPTQEELDVTMRTYLERLPAARADSLAGMLSRGGPSCELDRLLYRGVSELDPPHDRRLARALVTPRR